MSNFDEKCNKTNYSRPHKIDDVYECRRRRSNRERNNINSGVNDGVAGGVPEANFTPFAQGNINQGQFLGLGQGGFPGPPIDQADKVDGVFPGGGMIINAPGNNQNAPFQVPLGGNPMQEGPVLLPKLQGEGLHDNQGIPQNGVDTAQDQEKYL